MKSAIPWLIAVAACALAVWSWSQRGEAGPPPSVGAARDADLVSSAAGPSGSEAKRGPAETGVTPLRATQACLALLDVAESSLVRCRGASPEGGASGPECLADPEVARVVEQRIDDAILDHEENERDRRSQARERERTAFDEWAGDALQLTEDEGQWLEDYVCAARDLRERTLASLEEAPPVEALGKLKRQREQILEDMKETLGTERYAKLRAIGGIGLLADTSDCP